MIVFGESMPYFAVVCFDTGAVLVADTQLIQRYTLAVKHPEHVVIGFYQQFSGVGERLIVRKPGWICVPVWADDGQIPNLLIETAGDVSFQWFR